jgi:uncharacterized protein involved in exopolysaccharide biosynthesis
MLTSPKITDPPPALDASPGADETGELIQGVFEPPNSFVLTAIARNKLVVCAIAVLCALAGAWFGRSRPPTYTAAATLQIGQVNPNSPGFFGYVQSATSLANAFSRSIEAEPVLSTIQHKLKLAPAVALARLSAEPIALSPVFKVVATGPTQSAATQLANVAAGAVIAYESKSNSANPEAASLLHEYREASLELRHISRKLAQLPRATSAASIEALARAEAERSEVAVKLRAIGNSYTAAVISQAPRSGLVSLLAGAASATNNRKSKLELYGFVGLLTGIVLGCLTAVLRERLRLARRSSEPKVGMQRSEPA